MSQRVAVFVVLSSKPFDVVVTGLDGALLRPLILMREHVSLEILEDLSTIRV